jgi:DNA mismatch endonuclease (patch repair protein)
MSDVHTPEQRRRNMSAIRRRDTKPEMLVRRTAHAMGYRYVLQGRGLPGRPDLVFPSRRKAIFVHGCFWHLHSCRYGQVTPATNPGFWAEKRRRNAERDTANLEALKLAGWQVLEIWECETRDQLVLVEQLQRFLGPRTWRSPQPAP